MAIYPVPPHLEFDRPNGKKPLRLNYLASRVIYSRAPSHKI